MSRSRSCVTWFLWSAFLSDPFGFSLGPVGFGLVGIALSLEELDGEFVGYFNMLLIVSHDISSRCQSFRGDVV